MPEVDHKEPVSQNSEESLIDVDGPHIHTVPAEYVTQPVQTETQAYRRALEAEARAQGDAHKQKRHGDGIFAFFRRNADNPVIIGNVIVSALLSGLVGYQGWRYATKHSERGGWTAVAGATAAVGLFAVADYFVSKWALTKYTPRR